MTLHDVEEYYRVELWWEEAREWYLGWDPLSDYQWGTNHPQHHSHTHWHVGEWTRDQPKFLRWSWQFYIIRRWVRNSVIKKIYKKSDISANSTLIMWIL